MTENIKEKENKKIDLGRVLVSPFGDKLHKGLNTMTIEEKQKLPFVMVMGEDGMEKPELDKTGKPKYDMSKAPMETIKDIIIQTLSNHIPNENDRMEFFMVGNLINIFSEADGKTDEMTLNEKHRGFLLKLLMNSILSKRKEPITDNTGRKIEESGLYFSWVISQVTNELGYTEEEVEEVGEILNKIEEEKGDEEEEREKK